MEKEFVSYTQALALKELGFDEKCLMKWQLVPSKMCNDSNQFNCDFITLSKIDAKTKFECISAPLKQQVFRWFREKYEIHGFIIHYSRVMFRWCIDSGWDFEESIKLDTYEEAENACIDKLIKITKQQEDGK